MKKILSLTGTIILAAVIATNVYAAAAPTADSGVDQQAYDSTASLRTSLAADRAELEALMAGQNPDPQRARALGESISKSGIELERLLGTGGHMGQGYGHHGQGHMNYNMNGHHMAGCW